MTTIIKNARVADGSGEEARALDVQFDGDRITAVAENLAVSGAETVVDGDGFVLAPGFIDAHSHSDVSILASPEAKGKISQGITTEIIGNCGLSVFPISNMNRDHLQDLYRNYNIDLTWSDLNGYIAELEKRQPATNLLSLCGHNTLRAAVLGYKDEKVMTTTYLTMRQLLRDQLQAGAAGMSSGLLYVPGKFADHEELIEMLRAVAAKDRVYTTHMRNEGDLLLEAIQEAIEVCKQAGAKLHISHLKTAGKQNWHKLDEAIYIIDEARDDGMQITADRYPYVESMTHLSIVLPSPYDNKDDSTLHELLVNPVNFDALVNRLEEKARRPYDKAILVSSCCPRARGHEGRRIAEIAKDLGVTSAQLTAELLRDDPVTSAAFSGMSPDNMCRIMRRPYVCCGSDESARPEDYSIGRSHPRGFGSLPRFINMTKQWFSLEQAVAKVTSLPATIFGIQDRGIIRPGAYADLVLFDEDRLDTPADFGHPHAIADGIEMVWVNGKLSYKDAEVQSDRAGRFVRVGSEPGISA